MITRGFRSPVEAFLARFRQDSDLFREFCEDCSFDKYGFYAVVLGQAERSCILEENQDVQPLRVRTFEVRYSRDSVERKIAVRRENFFSTCTGTGKWSRIKPVRFKLDPSEKLES